MTGFIFVQAGVLSASDVGGWKQHKIFRWEEVSRGFSIFLRGNMKFCGPSQSRISMY